MKSVLARVKGFYRGRRKAWPWFDHFIRAFERYKGGGGDRLAAALTMYSILALLPIMLVAMSVLGYVMADDPEAQQEVLERITGVLPGVSGQLGSVLEKVETNRGTLGIFGIAGLLFSGLGGITALRDSLRIMWHQSTDVGSFLKKKAFDALTLVILAVTLAASFVVSALAMGGAGLVMDAAGIGGGVASAVLNVLSFAVGVVIDMVLFLVLFKWLPRVTWPWRRLVRGAVFGGVLFGLLKLVGGIYISRTATRSTALYGSIGTAVALLVGLYLVSRVILFAAAWTVTAPGWHDVEPSGTASPEAAVEAGIPIEEARGGESYNGGREPPDTNIPGRGEDRKDRDRDAKREPAAKGPGDGRKPPLPAAPAAHGVGAAAPARPVTGAAAGAVPGAVRGAVPASAPGAGAVGPSPRAQERAVLAARAVTGFGATLLGGLGIAALKSLRRS